MTFGLSLCEVSYPSEAGTGGYTWVAPRRRCCYYGSAINDMLDQVSQIDCPSLFHYGAHDPFIPEEKISRVEDSERAAAGRVLSVRGGARLQQRGCPFHVQRFGRR
jgi:dienelactone hydrolase